MIKYALACEHGHEFEGWFGSSTEYDDQSARGLLDCPVCGTRAVHKQIMAPAVVGARKTSLSTPDPQMRAMMMEAVGKVRRHVEEHFEDVGDAFAKEARAIHEGKAEDRGIYGQASPKDAKALIEDGVRIAPLPPKPLEDGELN